MAISEFLEFDKKQRAFDGMWETIAKIEDHDNAYSYKTETGQEITLTPEKWITIRVTKDEPHV